MSDNYYEADIVRHLSSRLPIDTFLLVKENIQMLGERPLSFYKDIRDLGNVYLVDPRVSTDQLLELSSAAIGISGTFLLEALSAGINYCAAYGTPEFIDLLPSGYQGYCGVEKMLNDFSCGDPPPHSILSLSSYVDFLKKINIRWSFAESNYAHHGWGISNELKEKVSSDIEKAILLCLAIHEKSPQI
jgi:hypothetical protein